MMKILWKIIKIAALVWCALFAVFYFDLDGKLLYYVWEPMMVKRFGKMERKDMTQMPYEMKDPIRPAGD